MPELNEVTKDALVCDLLHGFLSEHHANELPFFDAYWRSMHDARSDETARAPDALGLGANDPAHVGTVMPLVAGVLWAVVSELSRSAVLPTLDSASRAVMAAARELGVGTALADRLAAQLAQGIVRAFAPFEPGAERLVVQWTKSSDDAASGWRMPSVKTFSDVDVQQRFRSSASEFQLFVDEPNLHIQHSGHVDVDWGALNRQEQAFLLAMLEACRRGRVTYARIDELVFPRDSAAPEHRPAARARVKGQLDKALGGTLAEALKAQKGLGYYQMSRTLPHCWVRSSTGLSRLEIEP